MKNRFRFRAWDNDKKQMYMHAVPLIAPTFDKETVAAAKEDCSVVFLKNCVLMQSTELIDKNNKVIFEGDIVMYGKLSGQVVWERQNVCFGLRIEGRQNTMSLSISNRRNVKVIGNIYENPGLRGA